MGKLRGSYWLLAFSYEPSKEKYPIAIYLWLKADR
jgi:hypothetical protein